MNPHGRRRIRPSCATVATSSPDDEAACPACSEPSAGIYCSACGERAPHRDDERLIPFLRDSAREVLSFVTRDNADGAKLYPQVASRPNFSPISLPIVVFMS